MSGEKTPTSPPPAEAAPPAVEADKDAAEKAAADVKDDKAAETAEVEAAPAAAAEESTQESEKPAKDDAEKPAEEKPDVEMTDDAAAPAEGAAEEGDDGSKDAADKKQQHRKSVSGGSAAKAKTLNKKKSKKILHLDAKPGDYFFVKLKGFPAWPVIICDEDMLPASLLKTRPVTAKRADGTYREDFADGGKNVADRTFPVMYLQTNEFGWVPNTELIDLDPQTVLDVKLDKMRKDLQLAHKLAAEQHPLSYYKELLQSYQEELIEQEKAKAAKLATPKGKKSKARAASEDEDVEMEDAPEEDPKKSAKKRKAEGSAETPQRADSVKKPKIKLTTSSTPKPANGASATPKSSSKPSESKSAKSKSKKKEDDKEKEATPKEPELTPEERHARKEKEVLFLRHKLQKGLLTRDQEPKEEEMKLMSDYITKLEGFPDLEVSIIRATKINKVLKAILKLENIPKEDEFKFKPRSQVLLDKWNKLLAVDGGAAPASAAGEANGAAKSKTNGVEKKGEEKKEEEEAAKEKAKDEVKEKEEGKEETPVEAEEKKAEAVEAAA
ncbi:hypothetical protein VTJ49DRAFT_3783 [Mycothermus thermophilus]|uniref:PWWP domain-containing protein n=1 Tax=Humicola insolens TaxID=85995 RepID=A0ABR3V7K6_HUMIN